MRNNRMLKIYCAWLLAIVLCTSMIASVGTSYARYTYTGENQIVLYTTPEEPQITSNILMQQGCTVVMKDWNLDDSYLSSLCFTS